jgi:hypothetical protein
MKHSQRRPTCVSSTHTLNLSSSVLLKTHAPLRKNGMPRGSYCRRRTCASVSAAADTPAGKDGLDRHGVSHSHKTHRAHSLGAHSLDHHHRSPQPHSPPHMPSGHRSTVIASRRTLMQKTSRNRSTSAAGFLRISCGLTCEPLGRGSQNSDLLLAHPRLGEQCLANGAPEPRYQHDPCFGSAASTA